MITSFQWLLTLEVDEVNVFPEGPEVCAEIQALLIKKRFALNLQNPWQSGEKQCWAVFLSGLTI
jgi:hypothetical protein